MVLFVDLMKIGADKNKAVYSILWNLNVHLYIRKVRVVEESNVSVLFHVNLLLFLCHFKTIKDKAFISRMCIPYDKIFHMVP